MLIELLNKIAQQELGRQKHQHRYSTWARSETMTEAKAANLPMLFKCKCGQVKDVAARKDAAIKKARAAQPSMPHKL
jgi:hypothetical protein